MPLAVQTYEYLLHQIFSLMRTEAHANEARRKRLTQGGRNFFECIRSYATASPRRSARMACDQHCSRSSMVIYSASRWPQSYKYALASEVRIKAA